MAWSCVEHVLDVRGNVGSVLGKCKTLRIQTAWFTLCSAVFTVCTSAILHSAYSVFLCSVWVSEQTAIISLYNIN